MEIVEHHHERSHGGDSLEEISNGIKQQKPLARFPQGLADRQSGTRIARELCRGERAAQLRHHLCHEPEVHLDLRGRCAQILTDELDPWPERRLSTAVPTSSPSDANAGGGGIVRGLFGKPGLTDSGLSSENSQAATTCSHVVQRRMKQSELMCSPYEGVADEATRP